MDAHQKHRWDKPYCGTWLSHAFRKHTIDDHCWLNLIYDTIILVHSSTKIASKKQGQSIKPQAN